jgi:hypothetical protein
VGFAPVCLRTGVELPVAGWGVEGLEGVVVLEALFPDLVPDLAFSDEEELSAEEPPL